MIQTIFKWWVIIVIAIAIYYGNIRITRVKNTLIISDHPVTLPGPLSIRSIRSVPPLLLPLVPQATPPAQDQALVTARGLAVQARRSRKLIHQGLPRARGNSLLPLTVPGRRITVRRLRDDMHLCQRRGVAIHALGQGRLFFIFIFIYPFLFILFCFSLP